MQTIVYFTTKFIKIVQGQYRNKRFIINHTVSSCVPDDSVVNGVILDSESLSRAVNLLKQKIKFVNTTVVIDSNRVVHKVSILPKCTKKQMDFVVRNEFIDKNTTSDTHIYDYSVILPNFGGKNNNLVLCCALERSIISAYNDFFIDAEIKLSRIDVSVSSIINLSKIFKTKHQNKIICVVDDNVVNLLDINQNGTVFSNRSRVIVDEDGNNYFTEVMEKIYSYVQFKKSAAREDTDSSIFIIDCNNDKSCYDSYKEVLEKNNFKATLYFGLKNSIENENAVDGINDTYAYNLGMLV